MIIIDKSQKLDVNSSIHIHTYVNRCVHGCDWKLRRLLLFIRQFDSHISCDLLPAKKNQHVGKAWRKESSCDGSLRVLIEDAKLCYTQYTPCACLYALYILMHNLQHAFRIENVIILYALTPPNESNKKQSISQARLNAIARA